MTDESEGGVFRFTFYCDVCGTAKQSPPFLSETEGNGIAVDPAERDREHNDAYERANREMIRSFNRCPVCLRFVCDDCFYLFDDKYMCKECNTEAARTQGKTRGGTQGGTQGDGSLVLSGNTREPSPRVPGRIKKKKFHEHRKKYFTVAACLVLILGWIGILALTGNNPGDTGNQSISSDTGDSSISGDQGDPVEIDDRYIPLAAPLLPDENAVPFEGGSDTTGNATVVATVGATVGTIDGPGYLVSDYDGKAITVSNGRHAQIILFNQESNPCSLTFEIVLLDTGKSLYKSGLVAPGMCLEDVELDETLDAHEHSAILIISAYDSSNLEIMDNTRMEITLTAN